MKQETSIKNELLRKFDELPVQGDIDRDWTTMQNALKVAMPAALMTSAIQWKALLVKKMMWIYITALVCGGGTTAVVIYIRDRDHQALVKTHQISPETKKLAPQPQKRINNNTPDNQVKGKPIIKSTVQVDSSQTLYEQISAPADTILQRGKNANKKHLNDKMVTDTVIPGGKHKSLIPYQPKMPAGSRKKKIVDSMMIAIVKRRDSAAVASYFKKHYTYKQQVVDTLIKHRKKKL